MVKIVLQGTTSVSGQVGTFQNRVITDGGVFEAPNCCTSFLKTLTTDEVLGGVLDVRPDVNVPLTFSVGEIRDITKRTGTFSKTIVLPSTDNNNRILNHYYDVNIQAGTFDVSKLTYCQVLQNDVIILEDAILQLISVNKSQSTDAHEQVVNYEVLIKDTKAELFTSITNAELTDLDFSDLNHFSNSGVIVSTFTNTEANGFKYVLPYSNTGSIDYNARQLKPAIYAKTYFDRIFANAGFTYEWAGLQDARFDKLLIPYNGDENQIDWSDYKVIANNSYTTAVSQPSNGTFVQYSQNLTAWSEVLDTQNLFNPTTGVYTAPTDVDPTASQSYEFKYNITYEVNFYNPSGSPVQPYTYNSQTGTYFPMTRLFQPYLRAINPSGQGAISVLTFLFISSPLASGTTTFGTYTNTGITTPSGYISTGDLLRMRVGMNSNMSIGGYVWRTAAGTPVQVDVNIDIIDISVEIVPNSNVQPIAGNILMNEYVPQKVKQSDFVKSIFTMYNLFADIDPDNPTNIILTHRDEYYDNGAEKDWTYKLAKDREQNLEFLPDVSSKRLILTYKQDNDTPNTLYYDSTKEIYGQQEYIFNSEYVRDIETKEILFSPTPIAQTTFGAVVPMIDGQAPKTNIRILYDGGATSCGFYNIIDGGTTGTYNITTYPAITHFDDPITPSYDINFGTCDFYYYSPQTLTNNTLYNLYWRRTINQINEGKMLSAYFYLDEGDIHNLKLNDKIRIDNSWWNINRVIDYNANTEGLTKVELISVDSEQELAPFLTNTGATAPSPTTQGSIASVLQSMTTSSNVALQGSNAAIYGQGNTIAQSVKGVVIGNNKTLNEDGLITPKINGADYQNETYVVNLTQVGTNDPTAIELSNNIGVVTWTRTLQGNYLGTPTNPFDALYTYVMINSNEHDHLNSAYINTDGNIVVKTTNTQNHQHNDDILNNTTLEIRTY
jgi:hypothetical protein